VADTTASGAIAPRGPLTRVLDAIERIGNKLPDPALLFLILLFVVWVISWLVGPMTFEEIDPRTKEPIRVQNQLTGTALATFLARMVTTFTSFHPLGVVLVSLLGVGIAEHTGFINAGLKSLLSVTSARLLTPMVVAVGVLSHVAADAGYVLVIPLGGVIFHAAGRHRVPAPLLGRRHAARITGAVHVPALDRAGPGSSCAFLIP
jgi:aminobenzoyl-glutamate transport protein